jgi:hypothetical protein
LGSSLDLEINRKMNEPSLMGDSPPYEDSPAGWIITTSRKPAYDSLRHQAFREDRQASSAFLHVRLSAQIGTRRRLEHLAGSLRQQDVPALRQTAGLQL